MMNPIHGLTNMLLLVTEQVRVTPICSFPYRFFEFTIVEECIISHVKLTKS